MSEWPIVKRALRDQRLGIPAPPVRFPSVNEIAMLAIAAAVAVVAAIAFGGC